MERIMQRITDTQTTYRLAGSVPVSGIVADLEQARRANEERSWGVSDTERALADSERLLEALVQLFSASELWHIINDYSKTSRILFKVSLMVEPVKESRDF